MAPVKLPFADTDLASLVKRYSASTIVTMLREIARCKSPKLDWVMLCKSTVTGITNPKEYQAVWRSLAYRSELEDTFDDNESPLDDDSDLDVELDPVPAVSAAVAESISSFVKTDLQQHEHDEVMEHNAGQTGVGHQAADNAVANKQQGSGLLVKPDESAELVAIPNTTGVPYLASATQCAATHGESAAILSCSTSTKAAYPAAVMNQSDARKRRRLWTPEEDLALIAAVDKYGEGNWTTVLKNHYDFDRSASQLSQRWALIRKRREVQEKAGYGGSGVSLLASGYNNIERLDGPKPGTLAGPGMQKDTGRPGDKAMPFGNAPTPMKQPPSSASTVPVGKRNPGAATPSGTETTASVLETQRARALPAPGVSTSWAGVPAQRPQAHNQTSMRGGATAGASTALQTHKGAVHEGSASGSHTHASAVWRPGQGSAAGNQMFYTSTQPVTSSVPMDSKYSASRNMTTGVSRGSKGVHGPDPMIQAAAMAAGARIAPASTAASLLKAAQSGNVVHIGSGGLPRSKLGLSNQAGNGNAGGSSGIIHYIRTGSGGSSLATSSTSLQRTTSHHMSKNQLNRAPHPVGNSSPSSVPTVPPQAARNNSQVPSQAGKPSPISRVPATRGSSPQQQMVAPALTPASTPASTTASTSSSTPASTSTPTPLPTSAATPPPTSASTPSTSVPTPACGFCTTEPIADVPGEGTT